MIFLYENSIYSRNIDEILNIVDLKIAQLSSFFAKIYYFQYFVHSNKNEQKLTRC